MPKLSPHFSLAEFTHTDTGLPNQPDLEALKNLSNAAFEMEKVRNLLGHPIIVDSAYRSPEVNMKVRGVTTSAHCRGYAVDFTSPGFGNPTEVALKIASSGIKFDQLIREYGWVHLSFDPRCRQECLTKKTAAAAYEHGIVA